MDVWAILSIVLVTIAIFIVAVIVGYFVTMRRLHNNDGWCVIFECISEDDAYALARDLQKFVANHPISVRRL